MKQKTLYELKVGGYSLGISPSYPHIKKWASESYLPGMVYKLENGKKIPVERTKGAKSPVGFSIRERVRTHGIS